VSGTPRRGELRARGARQRSIAKRMFGPMVAAGAAAYSRARDLPKLIALWPHELDDHSHGGSRNVLAKLRRALRAERRRALAGHWSYDLNRHLGLLSAYRGELARLGPGGLKA
jgi:hypothetical protein